jgi:hypothetical protein
MRDQILPTPEFFDCQDRQNSPFLQAAPVVKHANMKTAIFLYNINMLSTIGTASPGNLLAVIAANAALSISTPRN